MKNIAVFFGGASLEHDVSVITGVMTVNSLDKNLFFPIPVYVDGKGGWWTGEILKDVDNYKDLDVKKLKRARITRKTTSTARNSKKRRIAILPWDFSTERTIKR